MKKLIFSISLILISASLVIAKPYCRIETVYKDVDCYVITVAWWDDNGTPNNSADDRRLGTDFVNHCK
jgi:hypothetical protein